MPATNYCDGASDTVGAGASTLHMSPGSGNVEVVHVFFVKVVVVVDIVEQVVQQVHGDGKVMPFRSPWPEWIDDGTTRSRCCCLVSGCGGSGRYGPVMSCVRGGQAYFEENGS